VSVVARGNLGVVGPLLFYAMSVSFQQENNDPDNTQVF
jgi:hypothetical protein